MLDINIRVINVELTEARRQQVYRTIGPLLRLGADPRTVMCDVIIRSIRRPLSGELFCILVRLKFGSETHYAIGMAHHFMKAVQEAEYEARRSISRSYKPDTKTIEYMRSHAHERLFVELFVT